MKILIIEDETMIAQRLNRLFSLCCQERDLACQANIATSIEEAKYHLTQQQYDLLSLDLNLNGENGFHLLQLASSLASQTIVISAHREQAIQAYEYGVLDFIAKPFSQARIAKALDRLLTKHVAPHTKYLMSQSGANLQRIAIDNIAFIEGYGNYSKIHLLSQACCLHAKGLDAISSLLPESFLRIHKSYILHLASFVSLTSLGGGQYEVCTQSGTKIPVGRTKIAALRSALNQ